MRVSGIVYLSLLTVSPVALGAFLSGTLPPYSGFSRVPALSGVLLSVPEPLSDSVVSVDLNRGHPSAGGL